VREAGRGPKFVRMQNMATKRAYHARRSRAEWTAEVIQWRKSGLGSAEYAKQRDLKRGTLLWWARQLGDASEARSAATRPTATPVTFVPLRVREEQVEAGSTGPGSIEVILCNGRRVRVAGAVDGGTLARVLDAAEGER
jgi:hypothetical protein